MFAGCPSVRACVVVLRPACRRLLVSFQFSLTSQQTACMLTRAVSWLVGVTCPRSARTTDHFHRTSHSLHAALDQLHEPDACCCCCEYWSGVRRQCCHGVHRPRAHLALDWRARRSRVQQQEDGGEGKGAREVDGGRHSLARPLA